MEWQLVIGWILLSGLAGFVLMGFDKNRARRGRWRVPERTFFTLAGRPFRLKVGVADRSIMRYAVIIGRDILRSGDFLIDPTRKKKKT